MGMVGRTSVSLGLLKLLKQMDIRKGQSDGKGCWVLGWEGLGPGTHPILISLFYFFFLIFSKGPDSLLISTQWCGARMFTDLSGDTQSSPEPHPMMKREPQP